MSRKHASMLLSQEAAVGLTSEWLEAFWCGHCYETKWYYVRRNDEGEYRVDVATREQWQQAQGVIHPYGNPSVGEYSRRHSCMSLYHTMKQTQLAD
ncbi:MAG: hypothetical protein WBA76_18720 [Phormidesmis sp.]